MADVTIPSRSIVSKFAPDEWRLMQLAFACPDCGAQEGESCGTYSPTKGIHHPNARFTQDRPMGRSTKLVHRSRRQLAIIAHYPEVGLPDSTVPQVIAAIELRRGKDQLSTSSSTKVQEITKR